MQRGSDWRGAGSCAGLAVHFERAEDDLFFLLPGRKSKRAKELCRGCPVRKRCLEYALIYGEQGIWGGTTEDDRAEYPQYIVEALRAREAATVGLESRDYEDFIGHQYRTSQVSHQVTVQVVTVQVDSYGSGLEEEPLEAQLAALVHLFEQTNALLSSLR